MRREDYKIDEEKHSGERAKPPAVNVQSESPSETHSPLMCYALRLHPGEEITGALQEVVKKNNLQAAFILSCVGSVRRATLRLADSKTMLDIVTNHEIVSLTGTLSAGGHLHTSLSDEKGKVIGGHVMGNMEVFTTAEIVIGNMPACKFQRILDTETSYKELQIDSVNNKKH